MDLTGTGYREGNPMAMEKTKAMPDEDDDEDEETGGHVEGLKTTTDVAKYSMIFFAFVGVAMLFLAIYLWDLTIQEKVLYWAVLSLALAFISLGVYSMLVESLKAAERQRRRQKMA